MSAQYWTPAVRPGLVPLHPLTFGALISKPFAALRHNPKVLFGFAIVIQLAIAIVTLVVIGVVAVATFTRVESLSPSSPDFYPVMWGTIAINALVVLAMSFVSLAFTAVMQGVVAADVGSAALREKAPLGRLWQRMRPAFWRLVGWSVLQALAAIVLMLVIGGIIALGVMAGIGGSGEGVAVTVVVGILLVLGAIPLWIWLSTKLLLVPSVLVLEGERLRPALVRSWRLTRGRFWNTFGVIFLIGLIMNAAVSVISVPLSLLGSLLLPVVAPTGGTDEATELVMAIVVSTVPQLIVYVLQAVAIVVQCAAAAFIYLDSRMRYEGLDHSLITYLERRDLGTAPEELGDPFAVDPERAVSSAPPLRHSPQYGAPPVGWSAYPPAQQHPAAPEHQAAQPPQPQYPAHSGPQMPPPPPPGYGGA